MDYLRSCCKICLTIEAFLIEGKELNDEVSQQSEVFGRLTVLQVVFLEVVFLIFLVNCSIVFFVRVTVAYQQSKVVAENFFQQILLNLSGISRRVISRVVDLFLDVTGLGSVNNCNFSLQH